MPPAKRPPRDTWTPVSSYRIPPHVKAAAARRAKAEDTDLTAVIVAALARYGKGW